MCFLPGFFKKILALRISMLAIVTNIDGAVTGTILRHLSKLNCII